VSDLVEFLHARLDEDEAWAKWAADRTTAEWHPDFAPRHDPARVLREVEAGRAILAAHGPDPIGKFGGVQEPRCLVCLTDRDGYEEQWEADPWPCATLRHLAAIYSDHPDYRQEWKP
jgi:hypothetical protein